MLAEITDAVVHTTGINWESIGAILGGFGTATSVLLAYVGRRADKRDALHASQMRDVREDFQTGLRQMGTLLSAKLETKETVANLGQRVARLEGERIKARGRIGVPD